MLSGAYTLLMTPFKKDLSLDEEGLKRLVRIQVENKIHGIAPLGVTGESPALTDAELPTPPASRSSFTTRPSGWGSTSNPRPTAS
jgi:hypothetical protein